MAELAALLGIGSLASTVLVSLRAIRRRQDGAPGPDDGSGIIELHMTESPDVDICFVHGLGGDRIRTWEWVDEDTGEVSSWPSDFLPVDTIRANINVRVLSYGYKSFAPTPEFLAQRTLYRHSQHLLSALTEARQECPKRPLILVGHSLGGIVIKSALIFSNQAKREDFLAVSVSTAGIVFLGTPHPESLDQSIWPTTLASIVKLTGVGDESLLKHLEKQSLSLQTRLQPFKALSENIPIVSYYEGCPSQELGYIVPNSEPGEPYAGQTMNASHLDLSKFSSRESPDYRMMADQLLQLCHEASTRVGNNWERHLRSTEEKVDSQKFMERVRVEEAPEQVAGDTTPEDFTIAFSLPQPRDKRFIGRTEDLLFLQKVLVESPLSPKSSGSATVNIHGPAGIGKTQLAREFAYVNQYSFSAIFWISASSRQSIEYGLLNIALTLRQQQPHSRAASTALRILADFPSDGEPDGDQLRATIRAVMEWFQSGQNSKWLVIYDNLELADDPDIMELIPRTTSVHGHCIITSQNPVNWDFVTQYELKEFSPDESYKLLRASTGLSDSSDSDLSELSKVLQYIPQKLSVAASYISSTHIPLREYLRRSRLTPSTDESDRAHHRKKEPLQMDKVLRATIGEIQQPLSLSIFQICCVLSMQSVCLSIFLSNSFKETCPGDLQLAIEELQHHSLVAFSDDGIYLVSQNIVLSCGHRLLSRDQRISAIRTTCESALSVAQSLQQRRDKDRGLDTSSEESDIADVLCRCYPLIKECGNISYDWDVDFDMMGQICERQGRHSEASKFYDLQVSRRGRFTPAGRKTIMRLAFTHHRSSNNAEAESLCEELIRPEFDPRRRSATPSPQKSPPLNDEVDIEALGLLRKLARENSDSEQELALSKQIATAQEDNLGPMHTKTLEAVQELARGQVEVGFYDEAESNIRRVLLSYENAPGGASSVKTTEALEILASIRLKQGKYDDAEELFNRALHNHLARLGRDHPTTQKCWAQLGQVYSMQRRYDPAGRVYDKCLAILDATLGADHPDVLRVRAHKAANLASQDRHAEAQAELADVLARMDASRRLNHENSRRRVALQLVDLLRRDPRADSDEAWLDDSVRQLEAKYDLDLHHRIGWMY
ncbi:hypothetical protein BX600DRAFT_442963 [Xylariales sp. PMI_506]|nr:hypothetical protein BX600DRAFT_442963 [Xylariales sp. PMI_506]